ISTIVALVVWLAIPWLLTLAGARGEVHALGEQYLRILIPSMPVVAVAMGCGAGLRALGDAKLSMSSTLAGGAVNATLDPIFIFLLGMGIEGAAVASVFARFTILAVSAYGIFYKHRLFYRFQWSHFTRDRSAITRIALPAMFTNLATPFSSLFVTRAISDFGDSYVAGYAIIGRIIPVAFGVIFALSGAIGPIVGQNYGAHRFNRVKQSLKDAYLFASVYILTVSLVLLLGQNLLVSLFNAREQTAEFVQYFCTFIAISFMFNGWQFIANASFNNLGKATWSTWLNWGKATLGTLPFIAVGSELAGAEGILMGQAVGGILFALAAVVLSFQMVSHARSQVEEQKLKDTPSDPTPENTSLPCSLNPLSSECAQMCQIAEETECENTLIEEASH
ncbi:MAG: MATE family efflux transporter, partial [Endozoicomonas sp.]